MKTKSKLVLALAVLTAGTAFAGASGTFAWFSVNRSAILSYSKVTAQATGPNLEAKFLATIPGVTSTLSNGADTQTATSSASYTADISSADGVTMAKPNWITEAGAANTPIAGVSKVTDVSKYFTRFIIKVTNTAADGQGDLDLYLDTNCAITPNSTSGDNVTKDASLAKWTRVGVVYLGTTSPTNVDGWDAKGGIKPVVFENADAGSTKGQYVEVNPSANTLAYAPIPSTTNYSTAVSTDFVVNSSSTRSSKNFIGTVEDNNTTVYLGVTVWMEGTELANQDSAKDGAVDIKIGLSSKEATA